MPLRAKYTRERNFDLPSVLLYDREYRKLQSAMKFRWGTDVRHLHNLHLVPRDKTMAQSALSRKTQSNIRNPKEGRMKGNR